MWPASYLAPRQRFVDGVVDRLPGEPVGQVVVQGEEAGGAEGPADDGAPVHQAVGHEAVDRLSGALGGVPPHVCRRAHQRDLTLHSRHSTRSAERWTRRRVQMLQLV